MPIYEYRCTTCGYELEAIQKVSEDPLKHCPNCDSGELVKKISAAAFRLKGGGWYETDFKSGKKRNVHGSDDGGSAGKGAGTSSGKEKSKEKPKDAAKSTSGDKPAKKSKSAD